METGLLIPSDKWGNRRLTHYRKIGEKVSRQRLEALAASDSSINGAGEAPVDAVALVEEAIERTESDVFRTARTHGVKRERFVFQAERLNPFVEGVAIAGEFGHGDGRKTAMENFIFGINALGIEILGAEFAG